MDGSGQQATLGGGCFWCLDAVFRELKGVSSSVCGYAGGATPDPSYQAVCAGRTGHAEVVQVTFDPKVLDYEELLRVFFSIHDPTTRDRQGADVGTQYRSIILCHDEAQQEAARSVIHEVGASGGWDRPIVTEVEPLERFWPAEKEHQDYFRRNQSQGYCRLVIAPKVAKARQVWGRSVHRPDGGA